MHMRYEINYSNIDTNWESYFFCEVLLSQKCPLYILRIHMKLALEWIDVLVFAAWYTANRHISLMTITTQAVAWLEDQPTTHLKYMTIIINCSLVTSSIHSQTSTPRKSHLSSYWPYYNIQNQNIFIYKAFLGQ